MELVADPLFDGTSLEKMNPIIAISYLFQFQIDFAYPYYYFKQESEKRVEYYQFTKEELAALKQSFEEMIEVFQGCSQTTKMKRINGRTFEIEEMDKEDWFKRKISETLKIIENIIYTECGMTREEINTEKIKKNLIKDMKKETEMIKEIINKESIEKERMDEIQESNYKRYIK